MSENNLRSTGALYLGQCLLYLKKLKNLNLNLKLNSVKDQGLLYLVNSFKGKPDTVKIKLDLTGCQIDQKSMQSICDSINYFRNISHLSLILQRVNIFAEEKSFSHISSQILAQIRGLHFDLSSSKIGTNGLHYLAYSLSELKNVAKLSLQFQSNGIDDAGVNYLADSLAFMRLIERLNLNLAGNIITVEGITHLCDSLLRLKNLNKLTLNLQQNKIKE